MLDYFSEGEINFGLFNSFINNEGKYNTGILSPVLYKKQKILSFTFISLIYTFS